jgi:hypothetical protein
MTPVVPSPVNVMVPVATPALAVQLGHVQVRGMWQVWLEVPPLSWRARRTARVRWGPVGPLIHPQIWRDEGL